MRATQESPRSRRGRGEYFRSRDPSVGGADLDEFRELQRTIGDIGGPQIDLLAVLPLQHQAGNRIGSDLERMRIGRILAFELNTSDRADIVRLLQCIDEFV